MRVRGKGERREESEGVPGEVSRTRIPADHGSSANTSTGPLFTRSSSESRQTQQQQQQHNAHTDGTALARGQAFRDAHSPHTTDSRSVARLIGSRRGCRKLAPRTLAERVRISIAVMSLTHTHCLCQREVQAVQAHHSNLEALVVVGRRR